jgi:hypothetical protein
LPSDARARGPSVVEGFVDVVGFARFVVGFARFVVGFARFVVFVFGFARGVDGCGFARGVDGCGFARGVDGVGFARVVATAGSAPARSVAVPLAIAIARASSSVTQRTAW